MRLINEFSHALKDGLGVAEAKEFSLALWSDHIDMAIAYAPTRKDLLLLCLPNAFGYEMTLEKYLDISKSISIQFSGFVVPSQKPFPPTIWGGKTRGPVHSYTFKVITHLANWN
jgi:hypothetical protein